MKILTESIWGTQINPCDGQEITEGYIEAGVKYKPGEIIGSDYFGVCLVTIMIDGYTYKVRASDLGASKEMDE